MIDQLGQPIQIGDVVIHARGGKMTGLLLGTVEELLTNLPLDRVRLSGMYETKVTRADRVIVFRRPELVQ